jgi:GAF domain-containing protein
MKCPRCQQENPPQAKFCLECAAPIDGTAQPSTSSADLSAEIEALRHSLNEALEQQTATSEILRVISQSHIDPRPVFDRIINNVVTLCDAQEGSVFRFDGQLIHVAASESTDAEFLDTLHRVFPRPPGPDSPTARAILTGAVTHVQDIAAEPGYESATIFAGSPHHPVGADVGDGQPIGAITRARRDVRPFSDRQLALLQTFADQAVIAIENVRLFNELQEKNQALTAAHAQATEGGTYQDGPPILMSAEVER